MSNEQIMLATLAFFCIAGLAELLWVCWTLGMFDKKR